MTDQNLTLLTDFYELTMMQGYFKNHTNDVVIFDAFYRENPSGSGYAICCGLDQVIDYIKNLHFDAEDIEYLRELIHAQCSNDSADSCNAWIVIHCWNRLALFLRIDDHGSEFSAFAYGITTTSWALLVSRAQYMDFIGHI